MPGGGVILALLRGLHAWAWTTLWLRLLLPGTLSVPMPLSGAAVLALLFTPLICLPIVAIRLVGVDRLGPVDLRYPRTNLFTRAAFRVLDGINAWLAAMACACMSALVLGFLAFMARFAGPGAGWIDVLLATVLLHVLAGACIWYFDPVVARWADNRGGA